MAFFFLVNFIFGTWTEIWVISFFRAFFIEIPVLLKYFVPSIPSHYVACLFNLSVFLLIPSIAKNKFLVLVLASGNFDKNKRHRIMVFGSFFPCVQ